MKEATRAAGVLTFHRAQNYGAVLQAFALQRSIELLGIECEIVDYRCRAIEDRYRVFRSSGRNLKGIASAAANLPSRMRRSVRFSDFRERRLVQSSTVYDARNIGQSCDCYDRLVVGSDQVWNPDLIGGDMTYFLGFCSQSGMKVAYAPSLGKSATVSSYAELYERYLPGFAALSAREQESSLFLSGLLGRTVEWVVDPVFLLPREEWAALSSHRAHGRPYIFSYCLHEVALYRYVEHLRRCSGYDVVYVPESIRRRIRGRRLLAPKVEDLLSLIAHADLVVTDSFHVLALSIILRREFKAQLKSGIPELNSRITSLLESLGLEGCTLSDDDYVNKWPEPIDYGETQEVLNARVVASLSYLKRSLGVGETV